MKKMTLKACAFVFAGLMLASCCTVSVPVAATSNRIGSKCGETTSWIYLGALVPRVMRLVFSRVLRRLVSRRFLM